MAGKRGKSVYANAIEENIFFILELGDVRSEEFIELYFQRPWSRVFWLCLVAISFFVNLFANRSLRHGVRDDSLLLPFSDNHSAAKFQCF